MSIYGALGEKDQEFAWLEKAYQNRDGGLTLFDVSVSRMWPHLDARYVVSPDNRSRMGINERIESLDRASGARETNVNSGKGLTLPRTSGFVCDRKWERFTAPNL